MAHSNSGCGATKAKCLFWGTEAERILRGSQKSGCTSAYSWALKAVSLDPVWENLTITVMTINCTAAVMEKFCLKWSLFLWSLFTPQIPEPGSDCCPKGLRGKGPDMTSRPFRLLTYTSYSPEERTHVWSRAQLPQGSEVITCHTPVTRTDLLVSSFDRHEVRRPMTRRVFLKLSLGEPA